MPRRRRGRRAAEMLILPEVSRVRGFWFTVPFGETITIGAITRAPRFLFHRGLWDPLAEGFGK